MPSGTGVLPIAAGTIDALQTRCGVSLGQTRAPAVKAAATSVRPGSDAAVHRGRIQDLVWPRQAPHPRTRSEDLVLGWGPATLPDDERASGGRSSSDSSVAISSNTGGSSSSCWECIETRESILRLARLISPRPASRPCRRSRAPGRSHLREQSKYGGCACTVHTCCLHPSGKDDGVPPAMRAVHSYYAGDDDGMPAQHSCRLRKIAKQRDGERERELWQKMLLSTTGRAVGICVLKPA